MKGSDFVRQIWDLPLGAERGQAFYDAIVAGSYVTRPLSRVPLDGGRGYIEVVDDYVSIGEEDDFVRVPLDAVTAQRVANHLGFLLPTEKMVAMIWKAAAVKLVPTSKPPLTTKDRDMRSVEYFVEHNATIEAQRAARTGLIAGHKKDVVITPRTLKQPGRVPICGWHTLSGKETQPLSLVHEDSYGDYSHGLRLVSPIVWLDGMNRPLEQYLTEPEYAALFTDLDDGIFTYECTRLALTYYVKPKEEVPSVVPPPSAPVAQPKPDVPGIVFKRARNYTTGRTTRPTLVVIHDMEAPELSNTAESVASFFANQMAHGTLLANGKKFSGSSCHYNVDDDSIVQSVLEKDTAWHAPRANHNGIGIEHAGYARQTAEEWDDAYSRRTLLLSAKLVAGICKRHGIPVDLVDVAGLLAGESGITTHHAVSQAFKASSHYDPGPNFPMDRYLALVRQYSE